MNDDVVADTGEATDGTDTLRPGAPGWQQAVNEHYGVLVLTLDGLDPEERDLFDADYAKKAGVLPDVVANRLRAGLLSADPADQVRAAIHGNRFRVINPALLAAIPEDERTRGEAINEFAALGLPSERAVELADRKLEDDNRAAETAAAGKSGAGTQSQTSNDTLIGGEGSDSLASDDDQLAGAAGEDELAMAAIRAIIQAARGRASQIGRQISDRLRRQRAERGDGQSTAPSPIAVETIANVVRRKLQERDQERADSGKKPTIRKLRVIPEDFGAGADPEEVVRALAEAQFTQTIGANEPAVQVDLEAVEDAWAARVKKDTARFGKSIDVSGLRHAIDTIQMAHAFSSHGPGNEKDSDNEPISPEAMAVYKEVVKNYDKIKCT